MRRILAIVAGLVLIGMAWQAPASQAAPSATLHIAFLSAGEVVPGPGDADGGGDIRVSIGWQSGQFCWFLNTTKVAAPLTAVHLHRGSGGATGEIVRELHGPVSDPDPSNCNDLGRDLAKDIVKNLSSYYIDVHNEGFPNGALRGQLDNGAPVSMFPNLSGDQVVPGPGDADGAGGGWMGVSGADLCFSLDFGNVSFPTSAVHLHRGAARVAGEELALLRGPSADPKIGDCVPVGTALAADIQENPQEYYVDMHNEEFPAGAVRGQLR